MEERRELLSPSPEVQEANRLFQSVWQRVMKGGAESPIVVGEIETVTPTCTCTTLATSPKTEVSTHSMQADCTGDFPAQQEAPFLGSGSSELLSLLQDLQLRELHGARLYRQLGRRVGGSAAQALAGLSAEGMRAAKRLGAACFLISGVQLQAPEEKMEHFPSYLGILRTRFIEEQQRAARYAATAAESRDPWLCRLLTELCEEKLRHAQALRLLVERACT